MDAIMENVRTLLELEDCEIVNGKIKVITDIVEKRLLSKLTLLTGSDVTAVPDALSGIVTEVCINRYNRIGSEGASAHDVAGESYTWASEDYFAPYMDDINAWVNAQAGMRTDGRLRFL